MKGILMNITEIYEKAYALMDEPVINGNCGTLCNYHCCRERAEDGDKMGIYLLPLEYEAVIKDLEIEKHLRITSHSAKVYEMPSSIKYLYFVYCTDSSGCMRRNRPIQCRTYPFEPHLENGELWIVVPDEQIHDCPLLKQEDTWRPEFIRGVYEGWRLLLTIPLVKDLIAFDSKERCLKEIKTKYRF